MTSLLLTVFLSTATAVQNFDYFKNSWSVIGLKDYPEGTRITPDNHLLLAGKGKVSLFYGALDRPLDRKHVKRVHRGWMPIIQLHSEQDGIRYEFTLWATPLPDTKDWGAAFDWPTSGDNYLNWILIKATNQGQKERQGVAEVRVERNGRTERFRFEWSLPSGGSEKGVAQVPFSPLDGNSGFKEADPDIWLERTVQYWETLLSKGGSIEVPCSKATNALKAAHVCQFIASDKGVLHAGEGFYDEFFIRDGAYQIMELEEAGFFEEASRAIVSYLESQRPDGRFETQKGQLDANGQALWALWQYYKMTGDKAWLKDAYPAMVKSSDWIKKARREAADGSSFEGLLPQAVADGEYLWDGKHHIVGYDFWNLRGLFCVADAARTLNRLEKAKDLEEEAYAYRQSIDKAWQGLDLAYFPPSWEKEGTHWGNTETLWPLPIFEKEDPRIAALDHQVRRKHGGGFVEGTIRWLGHEGAIHPYLSAYTTMASLARGEHEKVVEDFFWYLLHSSETHAFPEGIYYQRRFAWNNTIPHPTGASNYALLLRHMLIHEEGEELHLLKAVPDTWFWENEVIRIQNAPTHFGRVSLRVEGQENNQVKIEWKRPERKLPEKVFLYLPKSIQRPSVPTKVRGNMDGVQVVLREPQEYFWDFGEVCSSYLEMTPSSRQIDALTPRPWNLSSDLDHYRCLDLTSVANTDPFTAPFGVPHPGKFLFTGMPVGALTACGVPFEVIDPVEKQGRGFVVLHSPKAPKDREWPSEVAIEVNETASRIFFLGNVHGWAPQDPGTGEWGAVAEYVIVYENGRKESIPLITGRTADEWTCIPEAEDVCVGLEGDPWHLNVLAVEIPSATSIAKIVFRDLGTPAAPLLAAITLEKPER